MSKNVFVEAGSFRRLLLGAAGGYELQGYHEAAQTVMHVIDALDELTTGGKGRSQEDEDREAAEAAQRKGKKDGKYHDLVTDMLARAIHSVGIEYADEIAAYEEERRMRRSYYEKVENRANGLQEEEPDPLSPARAAIATAMQAAKVSEVTGAPLPKPLTWKRRFYDTTRTFPSGWYECPVCGCRADWEPEQCPKCYTRLEPEETEG